MSSLFSSLLSFLLVYKYSALFVIGFLSSMGVPVPAAASTVAAAAFAGQGFLNLFWVMISGSLGNIIGDLTLFWLVRQYGRKVLYWLHLGKIADSPTLRHVETTANAYKTWVIIASRFQDQATTLVNIISGLSKMDIKRFALLVVIGDVLQMAFYVLVGYLFTDTWQTVYAAVGKFSWIIALVLALFFALAAGKIMEHQLKKTESSAN